MLDNVCISSVGVMGDEDICPFRFVYETSPCRFGDNRVIAEFCCCLVTDGDAVLTDEYGEFPIQTGDIFFLYPSVPFTFSHNNDIKYLYISFVGNHPSTILENMGITRSAPVSKNHGELLSLWKESISKCNTGNLPHLCKGVLYYTFAFLQDNQGFAVEKRKGIMVQIRDYIDRNYTDGEMTLDSLCKEFKYNTKYISRKFKETFGVGFGEYLEGCRIRHACILLEKTDLSIQEIATSVGYKDPLYFSKVFKQAMFQTPSSYRDDKNNVQNQS